MFELQDARGNSVRMKNGEPFRYSTRELAKLGKRYLDVRDDTFYRIAEAGA
jgi:hypothetical protein